ncbi:MAG TPA: class I SAM-dependent methyltransferase [Cellvibrio sp.]
MQWKEQAKKRFSDTQDAHKWSAIYTGEQPNIEALSFRARRDFSVNYIQAQAPAGACIVDLGCGAGPVLSKLDPQQYRLIGMDYSADMLQLARINLGAQAQQVSLVQGECEQIPLPDESVDMVICLGVISYAESIENALHEISRILKPNGHAIITYRNFYNDLFMDPALLVKTIAGFIIGRHPTPTQTIGRSIPRAEVIDQIAKTHLHIVNETQIGFGTLRFNKKIISDGKLAARCNHLIHWLLRFLKLNKLYRAMADIHIIILKKKLTL